MNRRTRASGTSGRGYLATLPKTYLDDNSRVPEHLKSVGAPEAWAAGYRGDWVGVAIVDTGIDIREGHARRHLNFPPRKEPLAILQSWDTDLTTYGFKRVVSGMSFTRTEERRRYIDEFGHGTKVATIVGGRPGFDGVVGMVPQVRLLNFKVADRNGLVSEKEALQQAVEEICKDRDRQGIRVVLFALDSKVWIERPTGGMLKRLADEELVAVIAASDTPRSAQKMRPDPRDIDSSTTHPGRLALDLTPSLRNILVVAGHRGRYLEERLTDTSNFGKETVHLAAPALEVPTASPMAPTLVNGTSAAAALVAGAAAMVAGKHREWSAERVCECVCGLSRMSKGLDGKVKYGALDLRNILDVVEKLESSEPFKETAKER